MANKRIPTTELDFDQIKTNLKTFMQGQTEFQDYDFEGSALSTLLDVLAYNTHYNALYKNMAVNESFLDSASKRSSVVSRAKEIGYIPDSSTCSTATVNITVSNTNTTPSSLILPAFSSFSSSVNGSTYNFYTLDADIATISNNSYTFPNVKIKEGTPYQYKYTVAAGQRYIIPNTDVDLSTLKVRVQESATSGNFETYINRESIVNLTGEDPIYFIKEIDGQLYELEFGNNIVGKAVNTGNVISLNYMVCNKDLPNGAKTFSYQGSTLIGGVVQATTVSAATGGSDVESIESIRYNAPRAYTTQNRAVTEDDYRSIIYKNFSNAQSVSVWGGESNDPPVYGKVFISVKPFDAAILTNSEKQQLLGEVIKTKKVVSITPEIVDAESINLNLDVSVYYNPRLTTRSENELRTLVYQTIQDYNDVNLDKFEGIFRFSKLSALIDSTEASFVSNIMTVKLHRNIEVKYGSSANYRVNLTNPIYASGVPEQSVLTTGFYIPESTEVMYLEDVPTDNEFGILRMFYLKDSVKNYITTIANTDYTNIGTVDYNNGIIDIKNLTITGIDTSSDSGFEFIIKPQSNDVVSVRHQLVTIPAEQVTVNIVLDKTVSGDAAGNTNYIFTSSRN